MRKAATYASSMITVLISIILFPCWLQPLAATADSGAAIRSKKNALRDSLQSIRDFSRRSCTFRSVQDESPFTVSSAALFKADVTAPSEAPYASPLCVPVRYGFSTQLNRLLPYGNVAPLLSLYRSGPLLATTFDPVRGTDDRSASEFSSMTFLPNNGCRTSAYPQATVVPEAAIFWENGVFGEELLDVRFARPLSERLVMNAFSNFRHFNGSRFTHEGNNIFTFYQSLFGDTALLVNRGYNPLTNEYAAGLQTAWTGNRGARFAVNARYADITAEMALNRQQQGDIPAMRLLNQYRGTVECSSAGYRIGACVVDLEGRFENDVLVETAPDTANRLVRHDGANDEYAFAARAAVPVYDSGAIGLVFRARRTARTAFDKSCQRAIEQTPEAALTVPFTLGQWRISCAGTAGIVTDDMNDSTALTPSLSAAIEAGYGRQCARLYVRQSGLSAALPYDSGSAMPAWFIDRYRVIGGEIALKTRGIGLTLGCQSIEGIENGTVAAAWPEAAPPFAQPGLVLLAAPSLGPWHGFTLGSTVFLSDVKPVCKAHGSLSYSAHPPGTGEFIDAALSFNYWSPRPPILFAGRRDWNREVVDLGCEIGMHVGTFRFFGKIGNLLNRKFAYVPGYYSPGLTFRWGISWYLQK